MKIAHFEEIQSWRAARKLTNDIYDATNSSKFGSDLALKRQIRRSATSIMANIAEGFDSDSRAEFCRFLRISRRSTTELQSHLYVALDRRYIGENQFELLYQDGDRVKQLIGGFLRYLVRTRPMRQNVERRT